MTISIYVDGSGGPNGGYGYFVKETGDSFYERKPDITNNQAEYLAIISALKKFVGKQKRNGDDDSDKSKNNNTNDQEKEKKKEEDIIIYSDSKNTVNQLNHEFAINNEVLRELARETWSLIGEYTSSSSSSSSPKITLKWVPRKENLAGKMLGS